MVLRAQKGSITSWINNIESYNNLPEDIKEKIKNTKITLGYKVDSYSPSKFFKEHHAIDRPFNLYILMTLRKLTILSFLQVFGGLDDETFDTLKNHILKDEFRYDHH